MGKHGGIMGKTNKSKKRESDGSNTVRHLQGQIRSLQKQLKQAKKAEHILENMVVDDVPVEITEEKNVDSCPKCIKGKLSTIAAPHATFTRCDQCDFRHTVRK